MKYLLEPKDLEIHKADDDSSYYIEVSENTMQFLSHYLSDWIIFSRDRPVGGVYVIIDRQVSGVNNECLEYCDVEYIKDWAIRMFNPYIVVDKDGDDEMIMKLAWDGR